MCRLLNPKWFVRIFLLLGILSLSSGCANLNSISRTTPLDKPKAIHLDAQQRLLIMNSIGKYCTEPSPDALAAFAAAAGLGVSVPTQGAASAAGSSGSSAASIGLRTQSITLMRDTLYRMCEAYGNGQLSKPQVMTLLSRSQDLTSVVLATEQLTGAVVAQQAALSSTASSDATAVMSATSQLLEVALKQQERAQNQLEKALEKKADAEGKQDKAQKEHTAAKVRRDDAPNDVTAKQQVIETEQDLEDAKRQVQVAEEIRALREKRLKEATEQVESLQATQDSAATSAAASSSSNAALSGGGVQSRLNDQSTEAIALAVEKMVTNVLNKSYITDYCMAMISSENKKEAALLSDADRDLCRDIVREAMALEQLRIAGNVDEFPKNKEDRIRINCIRSWIKANPANIGKLDQWRKQKADNIDHVLFIYGKKAASLRSAAVKDLSISCN